MEEDGLVDWRVATCTPKNFAYAPVSAADTHLYMSVDHFDTWFDGIKSRNLPICDAGIGLRSAALCHLGNIAIRLGRKLTWDPVKEVSVRDKEANGMFTRHYRAPWKNPVS